jgi:hypothetical protein
MWAFCIAKDDPVKGANMPVFKLKVLLAIARLAVAGIKLTAYSN